MGARRSGVVRRGGGAALTAVGLLVLAAAPGWPQEPPGGLLVDKVVDADGDGSFADVEEAPASGSATFRVTLGNTTEHAMRVTSVVDVVRDVVLDVLAMPGCEVLATTLEPQGSVSCSFTLDRYLRTYADQPRRELTNRVEVVASHGAVTVTGVDEATVRNPNADVVGVEVAVATDADGDGVFTVDEEAPEAGVDVPVHLVVRNTSPGSVALVALSGTWGDAGPADLFPQCPALEGMRLWGAGEGHGGDEHEDDVEGGHAPQDRPNEASCTLTLVEHAPAAGGEVIDVVTATIAKRHDPALSATASASARVSTAAPAPEPDVDVELRVGPAGGQLGDHDAPPGAAVALPGGRGAVDLQVEVTNTGPVELVADVSVLGVDLTACGPPWRLSPGEVASCDLEGVAARAGPQVLRATATASGGDRVVVATDEAHYVGSPVSEEGVDRDLPAPTPTPTVAPGDPVDPQPTAPPEDTSGVAAAEALPRTGFPLVTGAAGTALVLLGLVLLGLADRGARPAPSKPTAVVAVRSPDRGR